MVLYGVDKELLRYDFRYGSTIVVRMLAVVFQEFKV